MTKLASVLKDEVARLVRKELRGGTDTLRKASAQYRSDIAALKRRVGLLERTLARAGRIGKDSVVTDRKEKSAIRFSPKGLASKREALGLSAADTGKLLGVSGQTVYHWESGKSKPRSGQLTAIAIFRKLGKREAKARLAVAD